jgi:hypothetical protein
VIERFSATRMADEYEAVYAKVLGLVDAEDVAAADDRVVEMRREVSSAS